MIFRDEEGRRKGGKCVFVCVFKLLPLGSTFLPWSPHLVTLTSPLRPISTFEPHQRPDVFFTWHFYLVQVSIRLRIMCPVCRVENWSAVTVSGNSVMSDSDGDCTAQGAGLHWGTKSGPAVGPSDRQAPPHTPVIPRGHHSPPNKPFHVITEDTLFQENISRINKIIKTYLIHCSFITEIYW